MHKHEEDERFLFCMSGLAEATGQEATAMKIKIYAKALEDMPVEDIEKACWQIIKTRTTATFPKVAEIREAVFGKSEDHAQLALNKIEKAIERYGNGNQDTVIFDDPYIHAAIHALGGWIKVSTIYWTEEWPFYRKDVLRTYSALCRTHIAHLDVPLKLLGYHDLQNSEKQMKRDIAPKLVGDTKQIELWQSQVQIAHEAKREIGNGKVKELIVLVGVKNA